MRAEWLVRLAGTTCLAAAVLVACDSGDSKSSGTVVSISDRLVCVEADAELDNVTWCATYEGIDLTAVRVGDCVVTRTHNPYLLGAPGTEQEPSELKSVRVVDHGCGA